MYNLITDPQYLLPQNAPDGNYCPTVGLSETVFDGSLSIYPNPAEDLLVINWTEENGQLQLVDMMGNTVISAPLEKGSIFMDISAVSAGVYLVLVNGKQREKLIIR